MNELMSQHKRTVICALVMVGLAMMLFCSTRLHNADAINHLTQSQVVMQGHSSLQIQDDWYEIG